MYYKVYISKVNKSISVVASGLYYNRDVEKLVLTIISQENYNPSFDILVDLRGMQYVSSFVDMLAVSSSFSEMKDLFKGKIGIVVKDGFIFRTFRLASQFSVKKGIEVSIFNDFEKATKWLADRRKERRISKHIS